MNKEVNADMSGVFDGEAESVSSSPSQLVPISSSADDAVNARMDKLEAMMAELLNRLPPLSSSDGGASELSAKRNVVSDPPRQSTDIPQNLHNTSPAKGEVFSFSDPVISDYSESKDPSSGMSTVVISNMAPPTLSSLTVQSVRTFKRNGCDIKQPLIPSCVFWIVCLWMSIDNSQL